MVKHNNRRCEMRGKRYTQEEIIGILKEAEAGVPMPDLCRKHGVSDGTIYNWKAKYSGLTVNEAHRLKSLEDENSRLKRIVANQALDLEALKSVVSKNF
jgi:putative transposase